MPTKSTSDRFIPNYLNGELRAINAHLPRKQKSLSMLLKEDHPHVDCNDGSPHFFKKNELEYLSQMLDENERNLLMLPIIMEVKSDESGIIVRSKEGIEAKIFSEILAMSVAHKLNKVIIFRPQLNVVRKTLKTTTQYVFL
jgi:uncharacterized protein (UPF0216 family)